MLRIDDINITFYTKNQKDDDKKIVEIARAGIHPQMKSSNEKVIKKLDTRPKMEADDQKFNKQDPINLPVNQVLDYSKLDEVNREKSDDLIDIIEREKGKSSVYGFEMHPNNKSKIVSSGKFTFNNESPIIYNYRTALSGDSDFHKEKFEAKKVGFE
jgi:hypothetical protein